MQFRDLTTRLALVFSTCAPFALGCGGGQKAPEPTPAAAPAAETKAPTPPAQPAPAAQPAAPAPVVTATPDAQGVVHLTANDQMRYSATRIEVKAGKFKVELKNVGTLTKDVMGHDFVVLKPGNDVTAFAAKAMTAKATDYIPADASEMITHSKLLGPGESDTVELDLTAGTYPYLCTFPGHVGLMNGVIVVQ